MGAQRSSKLKKCNFRLGSLSSCRVCISPFTQGVLWWRQKIKKANLYEILAYVVANTSLQRASVHTIAVNFLNPGACYGGRGCKTLCSALYVTGYRNFLYVGCNYTVGLFIISPGLATSSQRRNPAFVFHIYLYGVGNPRTIHGESETKSDSPSVLLLGLIQKRNLQLLKALGKKWVSATNVRNIKYLLKQCKNRQLNINIAFIMQQVLVLRKYSMASIHGHPRSEWTEGKRKICKQKHLMLKEPSRGRQLMKLSTAAVLYCKTGTFVFFFIPPRCI